MPQIPEPALVVLVGASAAGKSTWASEHFRAAEILSSDALRGVLGSGPADLDASVEAFAVLDTILAARSRRTLTTVVDTLGLDPARRQKYREVARQNGLPTVAVVFEAEAATCRARNSRRNRPVPAPVLAGQLRKMRAAVAEIATEGWDLVLRPDPGTAVESVPDAAGQTAAADPIGDSLSADRPVSEVPAHSSGVPRGVILQISRFPWAQDPVGWLREIAAAAGSAGFTGLALMDHLIQIPQVGRAWDPIPDPFVTLGLLAGCGPGLALGTLVSPVTFRPAGVLAKSFATLSALTGGRVFCGIGAGWWDREHLAYGLPFPRPGTRLSMVERAIETMRALWSPGTKAFRGEHVELPETTCYPRPDTKIPIIVGGNGEQRTLRIVAALADGCNLSSDPATLDRKLPVLQRYCADIDRPWADLAVTVLDIPVIGRDRDHTAQLVERLRGRAQAAVFARRHSAGPVTEHRDRYARLAERGVGTVFLALPDLAGPEDVLRCAQLTNALR